MELQKATIIQKDRRLIARGDCALPRPPEPAGRRHASLKARLLAERRLSKIAHYSGSAYTASIFVQFGTTSNLQRPRKGGASRWTTPLFLVARLLGRRLALPRALAAKYELSPKFPTHAKRAP
jgi:hypothetical protein